jgi:hypothetical protein
MFQGGIVIETEVKSEKNMSDMKDAVKFEAGKSFVSTAATFCGRFSSIIIITGIVFAGRISII